MRIAIHQNKKIFNHSTSWDNVWIDYCQKNQIDYEIVNCYENKILDKLKSFDCLLWHFGNYVLQDMLFARSILNCAKKMGLKVFPDMNTSWHFDDKIAETYLLQSIGAPIPDSWVYYTISDFLESFKADLTFPVVTKLRTGAGSHNVKLIKTKKEAIQYAKKMFSNGLKTSPNVFFKAKSNVMSSKNYATFIQRFKRIPDFIATMVAASRFPKEKGYVYFQEMIPNNGFDIKIVVVNDKLSFICRKTRENDFRASGGGELFFDKSFVTSDLIISAFKVSDELELQCMGYDYVVDKRSGEGKIIEMSYGFSHTALLQAGGYWDRNHVWHEEPLNAPEELLTSLMKA